MCLLPFDSTVNLGYIMMWLPVERARWRLLTVIADRSSKINSGVDMAILFAHIKPNASKLIGRRFTGLMDNDPRHIAKSTQDFLKPKKYVSMAAYTF